VFRHASNLLIVLSIRLTKIGCANLLRGALLILRARAAERAAPGAEIIGELDGWGSVASPTSATKECPP
jgi:hypothetical protein